MSRRGRGVKTFAASGTEDEQERKELIELETCRYMGDALCVLSQSSRSRSPRYAVDIPNRSKMGQAACLPSRRSKTQCSSAEQENPVA